MPRYFETNGVRTRVDGTVMAKVNGPDNTAQSPEKENVVKPSVTKSKEKGNAAKSRTD